MGFVLDIFKPFSFVLEDHEGLQKEPLLVKTQTCFGCLHNIGKHSINNSPIYYSYPTESNDICQALNHAGHCNGQPRKCSSIPVCCVDYYPSFFGGGVGKLSENSENPLTELELY